MTAAKLLLKTQYNVQTSIYRNKHKCDNIKLFTQILKQSFLYKNTLLQISTILRNYKMCYFMCPTKIIISTVVISQNFCAKFKCIFGQSLLKALLSISLLIKLNTGNTRQSEVRSHRSSDLGSVCGGFYIKLNSLLLEILIWTLEFLILLINRVCVYKLFSTSHVQSVKAVVYRSIFLL